MSPAAIDFWLAAGTVGVVLWALLGATGVTIAAIQIRRYFRDR
ncbi:hypothetical protein SEA_DANIELLEIGNACE_63 [Arthrobacter phage DanielleIgnace]|nr:hypothetical protein SEA_DANIELLEIGNACE_63 [Arthrobacter phage DanielleIgnace]